MLLTQNKFCTLIGTWLGPDCTQLCTHFLKTIMHPKQLIAPVFFHSKKLWHPKQLWHPFCTQKYFCIRFCTWSNFCIRVQLFTRVQKVALGATLYEKKICSPFHPTLHPFSNNHFAPKQLIAPVFSLKAILHPKQLWHPFLHLKQLLHPFSPRALLHPFLHHFAHFVHCTGFTQRPFFHSKTIFAHEGSQNPLCT